MIEIHFSTREKNVIAIMMKGISNKEIAQALDVTERTVEYQLGIIYAKLGVTSRIEVVIKFSGVGLWKSTGEADLQIRRIRS